jgi:hypothetical protein
MSHDSGRWVVQADGPEGRPLYLDDTGTGVFDPAEAKHFRSEADASAGIYIAELAPVGEARSWRVEPAPVHLDETQH